MKPYILIFAAVIAAPWQGAAQSDGARPNAVIEEPTQEMCLAAVAKAHALAERLPKGDPSRAFALSDLHQALVEAGNREFDDCVELAERATLEVVEHRHVLRSGETLDGLGLKE